MSQLIQVDDVLVELIKKERIKLQKSGCKNPSFSNAIRSMIDLPHISGKGRFDTCGLNDKPIEKIDLPTEVRAEKELEAG